ncbi:hypothetical protein HYS47_00225 [Candidatus Woesearchaeota archaeon]|nr:hypothetical protein [Candidatus Woesearchaeota archaeon]
MGILGKSVIGSVAFALGFYTAVQHMSSKYDYNPNKCDQYLAERLEHVKQELFPEFYQGQLMPGQQPPLPQQPQQSQQHQQQLPAPYLQQGQPPQVPAPPGQQSPQQQLQQQFQSPLQQQLQQRQTPLDHLEGLLDSVIDLIDRSEDQQYR